MHWITQNYWITNQSATVEKSYPKTPQISSTSEIPKETSTLRIWMCSAAPAAIDNCIYLHIWSWKAPSFLFSCPQWGRTCVALTTWQVTPWLFLFRRKDKRNSTDLNLKFYQAAPHTCISRGVFHPTKTAVLGTGVLQPNSSPELQELSSCASWCHAAIWPQFINSVVSCLSD